jgi:hypothetical protein
VSEDMIPGWTNRPTTFDEPGRLGGGYGEHFIMRAALVQRSTLTEIQITELVRTGRLTPYVVPANKKKTMFKISDIDALFTPVPVTEA